MKNLIFLFLVAVIPTGQAQVIQLEEAKVNFSPKAVMVSSGTGETVFKITERYKGQFSDNPILFMKETFNMKYFIDQPENAKYDSYVVNFKSSNGHLKANFNKKGDLTSTYQRFKNVKLPLAIKRDILNTHKGWIIKNNVYVASGKRDLIQKELYKIKLKNGKKVKTLRMKPVTVRLASN